MGKDFSMPIQWLNILLHPKTLDKMGALKALKYEMTVEDALDLLEYLSIEDFYEDERNKSLQKEK